MTLCIGGFLVRVLLVTLTDILPYALTKVLNPSLEYCAIVVDDVAVAKNMLKDVKPLQNLIYPFYELKECIQNFHYDLLIGIYDWRIHTILPKQIEDYCIEKNKVVSILLNDSLDNSFLVERSFRYYQNHFREFEMFATGISYTSHGLDNKLFKKKLFNFARAAQDLYYNYQVAKFVFNQAGGGRKNLLLSMR